MGASACKKTKSAASRLWFGSWQDADLRYLLPAPHFENVAALMTGGALHVLAPDMELPRLKQAVKKRKAIFHPLSLYRGSARKRKKSVSRAVAEFVQGCGARHVVVPDSFPLALALELRLRRIRVEPGGTSLLPERRRKTPEELKLIQRAEQIAATALRHAVKILRDCSIGTAGKLRWKGKLLGCDELRAEIERLIYELGGLAENTVVSCGPLSADPHQSGYGPLVAGQPIVLDIFPRERAGGYWGDLTRTVVKGRMPPELRRMYRVVLRAQRRVLSLIRSGLRVRTLYREALNVMTAAGFPTRLGDAAEGFIHNLGHGVGLEIHEAPNLGDVPGALRAGDVVTVEPGLYYRNLGGVRIEDLVLVTRSGFRLLSRVPLFGEIQ